MLIRNKTSIIEAEKVLQHLYSVSIGHRDRVIKEVARELLLKDCLIRAGTMYEIKQKHLGLGIYEVWMQEKSI